MKYTKTTMCFLAYIGRKKPWSTKQKPNSTHCSGNFMASYTIPKIKSVSRPEALDATAVNSKSSLNLPQRYLWQCTRERKMPRSLGDYQKQTLNMPWSPETKMPLWSTCQNKGSWKSGGRCHLGLSPTVQWNRCSITRLFPQSQGSGSGSTIVSNRQALLLCSLAQCNKGYYVRTGQMQAPGAASLPK